MIRRETRRPPGGVRRLPGAGVVAGACLAACASTKPVAEPELRAQIQALLVRQAQLERKVELLESRVEVARSPRPAVRPSEAVPGLAIPKDLATIKLGPPRVPSVPTSIALREPDAEYVRAALEEPEARAGDESRVFDAGMDSIRTGDVEGGVARLIAFADRHPKDDRAATALFTAGVGLLTSGDPAAAAIALERVSDDYPAAAEAPEATVHLAQCKLRLKKVDAAKAAFAKVIDRYPKSHAAKAAEAELKSIAASQGDGPREQ